MEFRDVLQRRRMVRSYLPDPVDPAAVERILQAARRAPSAGYSQGQAFVLVTDAERRRRIAQALEEQHYVERGGRPGISDAPVHVVPLVRESLYHERYQRQDKLAITGGQEIHWPVPYWYVDIGASLMAI